MAKPRRNRAVRREGDRAAEKLKRELLRVDALTEGGAPERPVVVDSPSVVETLALGRPCPVCEGSLELLDHQVRAHEGISQRVAILKCRLCRTPLERFFVLRDHISN